jgi:hypothetical protein
VSLDHKERKYSSARRKYESTKERLSVYKSRLENEQTLVKRLKETLTPDMYRSLGSTYATLGAFLSAVGLPQIKEENNQMPKEESD